MVSLCGACGGVQFCPPFLSTRLEAIALRLEAIPFLLVLCNLGIGRRYGADFVRKLDKLVDDDIFTLDEVQECLNY